MQNAPSFSLNITNTTSTYTFDENNVNYLELQYVLDGTSYICYNGTGDACTDSYNRQTTLARELNPGQRLQNQPVGQAYQMNVTAQ
jgi:hypothetical protein